MLATDFAAAFVRKIKHKMERSREVLTADADLLDIATEGSRMASLTICCFLEKCCFLM